DQIGFGKSSKPVHYQYSFPTLARHTRALMASLGIERSIVVGHSMGGMLASRFALMYPQAVQHLVLVNPIGLENYLKYVEHKDTDFFYGVEQKQTAD
ncbi:alpha/beta fold hydrolase, partial [Acinetobacter baumannii]